MSHKLSNIMKQPWPFWYRIKLTVTIVNIARNSKQLNINKIKIF